MFEIELQKKNSVDVDWDKLEIPEEVASSISMEAVDKYQFIPFREEDDFLDIAVVDYENVNTQNALKFFANKKEKKVRAFQIDKEIFDLLIEKLNNPKVEIDKALESFEKESKEDNEALSQAKKKKKEKMNVLQEAPVAKIVEVIIKNAIDGGSSDIHIEPLEDNVRVRFRVDGVLHSSLFLPSKIGPAVVSRIKILSNLKIDEKRKPQDGRFRIKEEGQSIDFRISTFPVSNGEKVVMRILDKDEGLTSLGDLGFVGRDLNAVKEAIKEPYGIILITGPTGSGKSTTLYAILRMLNEVGVNIVTLEDPVEYVLDGVSQSQVRPEIDYTFASGLRSILRQDPDIVMVGEIRDTETAELAVHAALTGHLVLSTLHTNTAIGAVPRLIDMGIQSFLLSSALRLVVGQRLVRRICSNCKTEKESISNPVKEMINKEIGNLPKESLGGIEYDVNSQDNYGLYYGKGCRTCSNQGMKGRVSISEVLDVNKRISQMIGDESGYHELIKAARKDGFTTMKQDGIIKALEGKTTIEEVQRVTEDDSGEEMISAKGEQE
ncbi:MAG: GspE/PulE family protein [Candidatus Moranbacteria bacterium]|nr:GspE/PulE family protein [Candidatus Moranbacteria bacterium]